jgi:hypothetical protein
MLPEKAANAVIVLEILTKMILSALAEKITEGEQDALLAEHADLGDLLIVQRLLGRASSTMRSLRYIRRTNLLVARAIASETSRTRPTPTTRAVWQNGRRSDARTRRTPVPVGGEAA